MEVLKLFAPYGPGWLGGVLLGLIAFYFGRQFLDEYKRQNERKAGIDMRPRSTSARSGTASARRWRAASPRKWNAATRSWRP